MGGQHADIFFEWLRDHFLPRKPLGTVMLILDGHTSHSSSVHMLEFAEKNGIILVCLPSHTTHYLQPLDRSVFKSIKHYFYSAVEKWQRSHPDRKLGRLQFGELLQECWGKAATPGNAVSGFKSTGIYPFNPDAIPDYAFRSDPDRPTGQEILNTSGQIHERTLSPLPPSTTRADIIVSSSQISTEGALLPKPYSITRLSSNSTSADKCGEKSPERRVLSPVPGPSTIPDGFWPVTSSDVNQVTPTKILNNISPLPAIRPKTKTNKRRKIKATNLTSKDHIKKLKLKLDEKGNKSKPIEKKIMKKVMINKGKETSDSSDSSNEIQYKEDSSDGLYEEEEECVGCGESYSKTDKTCDWIQCVRCKRWLHESCTSYVDVCHRCGKAIIKK